MDCVVFQRVKMYIDDKQISLNALAKKLNMNQSTVLRQVKGEQTMSSNLVETFLKAYPDVSAEWLLRGKGNMLLEDTDGFAKPQNETSQQKLSQDDGIWQAKYEELEKRYDQLLSILGGTMGKRNVG